MHDWATLVRERLGRLDLAPEQKKEIVAELAAHLDDCYEEQRGQGLSETKAMQHALDEVCGWRKLARKIQRAKREEEIMNYRTKSIWLPGLVSLTAASVSLAVFQFIGWQPRILWMKEIPVPLFVYLPWLVLLPLCGAAGAYLSRRAGGERPTRVLAGLFPSIVMLGAFCLILVVEFLMSLFVDRRAIELRFLAHHFAILWLLLLSWVVLPGVLLLLGALPFLRARKADVVAES